MTRTDLISKVMQEVKNDVSHGDVTAIAEMLETSPDLPCSFVDKFTDLLKEDPSELAFLTIEFFAQKILTKNLMGYLPENSHLSAPKEAIMEPIETLTKDNKVLKIFVDETAQNPRKEFDNLGTLVDAHKRYNLGDDKSTYDPEEYGSFAELKAAIEEGSAPLAAILPVYMYDHSGQTVSTTPFSCRWDSFQIGWIYVTEATMLDAGVDVAKAEEYLKGEIETLDRYLQGEVFGFILEIDGVETDSCWGFWGSDHKASGLFDQAGWEVNDV